MRNSYWARRGPFIGATVYNSHSVESCCQGTSSYVQADLPSSHLTATLLPLPPVHASSIDTSIVRPVTRTLIPPLFHYDMLDRSSWRCTVCAVPMAMVSLGVQMMPEAETHRAGMGLVPGVVVFESGANFFFVRIKDFPEAFGLERAKSEA